MKFLKIFIFILCFLDNSCGNQLNKYFTLDDLVIYNSANNSISKIKKNTSVPILTVSSNFKKLNNEYGVLVKIDENQWINARYVSLKSINRINNKFNGIWIPIFYNEAIKKSNKEIIYEYQEKNKDEYSPRYFWHFFTPTVLFITGSVIYFQYYDLVYDCIINEIKENDENTITVSGIYKEPGIYGEIENVNFELRLEDNRLFIKSTSSWKYLEEEFVKVDDATFDKLREITALNEE